MRFDDRYKTGEMKFGELETAPNSRQNLMETERRKFDFGQTQADYLPRDKWPQKQKEIQKALDQAFERHSRMFGGNFSMQPGKMASPAQGWRMLEKQVEDRNEAFEKRQQMLAERKVEVAKNDPMKAKVIGLQIESEAARYEANLAADNLGKDIVCNGPNSRAAPDLIKTKLELEQVAEKKEKNFQMGVKALQNRDKQQAEQKAEQKPEQKGDPRIKASRENLATKLKPGEGQEENLRAWQNRKDVTGLNRTRNRVQQCRENLDRNAAQQQQQGDKQRGQSQ